MGPRFQVRSFRLQVAGDGLRIRCCEFRVTGPGGGTAVGAKNTSSRYQHFDERSPTQAYHVDRYFGVSLTVPTDLRLRPNALLFS